MREALHYERRGDVALCRLCPHRCEIAPGAAGLCGWRADMGGILYAASYEEVTDASEVDVEAIPLFHYRPGLRCLAVTSLGANLPAEATAYPAADGAGGPDGDEGESGRAAAGSAIAPWPGAAGSRLLTAAEVVDYAEGRRLPAIAAVGPEPFTWFEFLTEIAERARARGLRNLLVTNGLVEAAPLAAAAPLFDAVLLVLLGAGDAYRRYGLEVGPVLSAAAAFRKAGAHVEAMLRLIPGLNDGDAALDAFARLFRAELGAKTALHVAGPITAEAALPVRIPLAAGRRLRPAGLRRVYVTGVPSLEGLNTACAGCGRLLVDRLGPRAHAPGLAADGSCAGCGEPSGVVIGP